MKRYFRFFLTLFIFPVAAAFAYNIFSLIVNLGNQVTIEAIPFWIGLGSYFLFQIIFSVPVKTYVFGHELTHAIAGIISGAKVKKFNVSSSGGSVELTKTSLWIALSPYFIPIYTLGIIIIYWAGSYFGNFEKYYSYFLFLAGFSLAFHLGLTHYAIQQGQSDLKKFGVIFSGVIILLINCIVIAILLKLLFPFQIKIKLFFYDSWKTIFIIYKYIYLGIKKIWILLFSMKSKENLSTY